LLCSFDKSLYVFSFLLMFLTLSLQYYALYQSVAYYHHSGKAKTLLCERQ
jgi:hypothetical protein